MVRMTAALMVAVLVTGLALAVEETPYQKAKIGDWVKYKITSKVAGMTMSQGMKKTVTAKSDTEITLSMETSMNNMTMPAQETKVPLAAKTETLPAGITTEKIAEGKEDVKVGDKTYACTWIENRTKAKEGDKEMVMVSKVWTSPDVPLDGIVKMENKTEGDTPSEMTMEMEACGVK